MKGEVVTSVPTEHRKVCVMMAGISREVEMTRIQQVMIFLKSVNVMQSFFFYEFYRFYYRGLSLGWVHKERTQHIYL
jgi:hypothetical protein